jgi:hypothetical protein
MMLSQRRGSNSQLGHFQANLAGIKLDNLALIYPQFLLQHFTVPD